MIIQWKKHGSLGSSVKNRNDESDYDYLHKLDNKTLNWLKGFHREYVNADFKHNNKKLFGKRKRKMIYDRNNARNRDIYNVLKWTGKLYLSTEVGKHRNKESVQLFERFNNGKTY